MSEVVELENIYKNKETLEVDTIKIVNHYILKYTTKDHHGEEFYKSFQPSYLPICSYDD